MVLDDMCHKVY